MGNCCGTVIEKAREMGKITLEILGGGEEVGRLSVLVSRNNSGILLDCGINFDENGNPQMPLYVPPKRVKAIALTHAHLDHTGAVPLYFVSSKIPTYMTKATKDVLRPLMEDYLHISGYYLPFEYEEIAKLFKNTQRNVPATKLTTINRHTVINHNNTKPPRSQVPGRAKPRRTATHNHHIKTLQQDHRIFFKGE